MALPKAIDSCGERLVLEAALRKHEVARRRERNLDTATLRKGQRDVVSRNHTACGHYCTPVKADRPNAAMQRTSQLAQCCDIHTGFLRGACMRGRHFGQGFTCNRQDQTHHLEYLVVQKRPTCDGQHCKVPQTRRLRMKTRGHSRTTTIDRAHRLAYRPTQFFSGRLPVLLRLATNTGRQ